MNLFKKISVVLIITLIHQFIITSVMAQTPNQFKYQAVLRDASGVIMANEDVTVDISILQGSASGTSVFTEQHSVTTTAQGLINLNIGSVSDLSVVDFSSDTYFIEISVNGTVMGTSQLLSVPYALQAKNVENVDYSQITNTPTLFDGNYNSLTNLPTLFNGSYNSLTDLPTLFDGDYNSLTNQPTLFDGAWSSLSGTAPNISIFTNDAGYLTSATAETDPIFTAWDKTTGISITESQISDFGTYLTSFTETDPIYTADFDLTSVATGDLLKFDGSKFVKFTPNYLSSYAETDPIFTAWDKSTGISITESQISDFGTYLTSFTETDPIYTAYFDLTSVATGDLLKFDGSKFVKFTPNYLTSYTETDPIFTAWDKNYTDLTNKPINATTSVDGFMSSADKIKLDGLTNADGSETSVTAGTNVTVTGTGTSGDPYIVNATGGSATHYVGELYGGGIVYYVYDEGQHGLIASLDDLDGGSGVAWSAKPNSEVGASAKSFYDGASNTAAILAQDGTLGYAATLCNSYTGGGQTDWYLPASWELNLLYNSAFMINEKLENDGDGATNGFNADYSDFLTAGQYWSSTEGGYNYAWLQSFPKGSIDGIAKNGTYRVRAVRTF